MERIIIKHRKGSKADQTEIFTLKDHGELTFGRDPSLNVSFDPQSDDWVSRKHATIQWDQTGNRFTLVDHNSRNGVFLNKKKINERAEIHHGDSVQLGAEGPEFIFELDPPPVIIVPPTKKYQMETLPPTREGYSSQQTPNYIDTANSRAVGSGYDGDSNSDDIRGATADTGVYHRSVGQETVERLIYQNKSESRKYLINVAALLLGLVIVGIGYFIYANFSLKEQLTTTQQDISNTHEMLQRANTNIENIKEDIKSVMSPKEIMNQYSQATVFIESKWKLIHKETGKELYQYIRTTKDKRKLPTYIELPDGTIQPRLIIQDQRGTNALINPDVQGSGFLVKKEGFIITCRHLVETWNSPFPLSNNPGLLYSFDPKTKKLSRPRETNIKIDGWIPTNTAAVWIDENKIADSVKIIPKRPYEQPDPPIVEGRLDKVNIVFAKTKSKLPVSAQVVRISDEHDVALLKVDQPQAVESVELNDNYKDAKAGDTIAVIGYPSLSGQFADPEIKTQSKDWSRPDEWSRMWSRIPNPTIATGVIGKILRGTGKIKPTTGELYEYKSPHDSYQLTINSLGAGTSGAPVFDDHGRVIGIFYTMASDQGSAFTYAIPIRYGMELMNIQPAVPE